MLKIFTFGANRPDFVELQLRSFHKHLQEPFDFTVFNNALYDSTGGANYNGLHEVGRAQGIRVIDIQKEQRLVEVCQSMETSCPLFMHSGNYSNANVAHAYALCWAWQNVISRERGPIAIMDSDVFLIEPVRLTDYIQDAVMANIPDGKPYQSEAVMYMWPTFMLADLARLPEPETLCWWCGRIKGVPVDVGGQTYHYFQAHPELKIFNIPRAHFSDNDAVDFHPANYDEFYLDKATVLHYRSGSNWNQRSGEYHAIKTAWLRSRMGV